MKLHSPSVFMLKEYNFYKIDIWRKIKQLNGTKEINRIAHESQTGTLRNSVTNTKIKMREQTLLAVENGDEIYNIINFNHSFFYHF